MTPLAKKLKLDFPIVQAPMAGVSTPGLAAAVSNAGALGSLGLGAMGADKARAIIRETRAQTARPFHANVFCHTPAAPDPARDAAWLAWLEPAFARFGATPPAALHEIYTSFMQNPAMLQVLLDERPAVVSFHFGLPPLESIRTLREAGIFLLASATNLDDAREIVEAGIDGVIAQGFEAGGHRGSFDEDAIDDQLGTLALTRLLARELDVPVIAAGGIMDGAGIAAALALGAEAAQLGTAFIACPESSADGAFRAALLGPATRHTTMTRAISGRPARGLANEFTALGAAPGHPPVPTYPYAYAAGKALIEAAERSGNTAFAAQWAGQGAPLARALPAAELVAELVREIEQAARPNHQ